MSTNKSLPTVTVIIPTFNRATSVVQAVQSVERQTHPNEQIEIVVVDDGSTDGTEEALARACGRSLRYVKQANAGPSAARNHGLRLAAGELIAFLDSDDTWRPQKLEKQVRAFADPRYCAVLFELASLGK